MNSFEMQGLIRNAFFLGVTAFFVTIGTPILAQEPEVMPLDIDVSIFYLPQETMDEYLKDGIHRSELDAMQNKHWMETGLLPQKEPLTLHVGEQSSEIPATALDALRKTSGAQVVVFFFEFTRSKARATKVETIDWRSYSLMADAANAATKEVQVKKGSWTLPAQDRPYRLFAFRSASILKGSQAVYELHLQWNGEIGRASCRERV